MRPPEDILFSGPQPDGAAALDDAASEGALFLDFPGLRPQDVTPAISFLSPDALLPETRAASLELPDALPIALPWPGTAPEPAVSPEPLDMLIWPKPCTCRHARRQVGRWTCASVLLHAVCLLLAVWLPSGAEERRPMEVFHVELLPGDGLRPGAPGPAGGGAPEASAPVAAAPQTAPPPEPLPEIAPPAPRKPKPLRPAPPKKPVPSKKRTPQPAKPAPAKSASMTPTPAAVSPGPAAMPGPGSGSGPGSGGGSGGGTGSGGGQNGTGGQPSPVSAAYLARVRAMLQRAMQYPPVAIRAQRQGVVLLGFTVAADGGVRNARILRSSGFPILDREALVTLRRCTPLPPLPSTSGSEAELRVPLAFLLR